MYHSKIAGLGFYVPSNVVTNDDLTKSLIQLTNDSRTGIEERRHIIRGEDTTTSMGLRLLKLLLNDQV
jgi:3-oxoacyl-[acyl-carrier-protein] synthase-3